MSISTQHLAKSSDLVTRCITGETIVVPVKDGAGDLCAIYILNESASRIWHLLDHSTQFTEIVKRMVDEYQVTEQQAGEDIRDYLDSLLQAGLVRVI
jgi:hypothetical protein